MWKYLVKRTMYMILTVWVITVISFVLIQLPPGDYVTTLINQMIVLGGREMTPEYEQKMRDLYGLNEPVTVQYYKWITNIVTKGEFGYSFVYKRNVVELVTERMPMTASVSIASFFFVWMVALPIGIYSAVRQYSAGDYVATFI